MILGETEWQRLAFQMGIVTSVLKDINTKELQELIAQSSFVLPKDHDGTIELAKLMLFFATELQERKHLIK